MPRFETGSKLKRILLMPVRAWGAALRWLANISEKFEKRFQKVAVGASRVGDAATQADSFFGKFISVLLSPFVWIWNWLIHPVADLAAKSPIFQQIGRATYWIWYPAVAVTTFCRTLLQTRSSALLIWSLPILAIIGGSIFLLWVASSGQNEMRQEYRKAWEEAIAKGEFQQASLYQQKLQSLGMRTEQTEMRQIEDLVKSGKLPQAIELAERLAPLDEPGFPEAHFWLARVYFDEQADLKGVESLERSERHLSLLKQALQKLNVSADDLPPTVVLLNALIELRKNNVGEALKLLSSISDRFWPALILQLETYTNLARDDDAIRTALELSKVVKKSPELLNDVSARFFPMWCQALAKARARDEFKAAVMIWHQKFPDDSVGLIEWSGFQFQEIDTLMARGSETDLTRATNLLIETTNRLGSKNQPRISSWLMERLPPKKTDQNYLKLAERSVMHADVSGTVLEILGTAATFRGEYQLSLDLLKLATQKTPENSIAWNNLAYVANVHFENEIELALEAANKAAQMEPENVDILHTRGFIRIKLKQWDLAIEDLRMVVARNPNDSEVHQGLAKAYEAIGKTELASFHTQLAQTILRRPAVN